MPSYSHTDRSDIGRRTGIVVLPRELLLWGVVVPVAVISVLPVRRHVLTALLLLVGVFVLLLIVYNVVMLIDLVLELVVV